MKPSNKEKLLKREKQ